MQQSLDINLFYFTLATYFAGLLSFSLFAAIQRAMLHRIGAGIMLIGGILHTIAFFVRWWLSGHIPLSNMYEYLSLTGWMSVLMLLIIYFRYNRPIIGSFISPIVFMLMVAAALLPKDINQSLMPALQSIWLNIHVSLAALGAGCFLVSFAVSSVYLIKQFNPHEEIQAVFNKQIIIVVICLAGIPFTLVAISFITGLKPPAPSSCIVLGKIVANWGSLFILLGLGFILSIVVLPFILHRSHNERYGSFGGWLFIVITISLLLGGLVEGGLIKAGWLELTHNLSHNSHNQTIKSSWLFFEFIGFAYAAGLLLSVIIFPAVTGMSRILNNSAALTLDILDEVSYRSVSLGYPLYTVGALFAGAIWAEQAWGSFWSWDPKEVGALIIWLFYSGYLHARYQRGWKGHRAAILVVAGFLMVLISFFGNYFFGGLHTYT